MKNIFRLGLLIFVFFVVESFQEIQPKNEKSILWEITGNELNRPSYLFGTIHLIPKDSFYFPEFMEDRLTQSEMLVTEISMDIPLKEQIALAQRMMLPDEKTFQDYMTEEEYSHFESFLIDSLDIKPMKVDAFTKIKPIYVPGLILNELVIKPTAYEMELSKIAKKKKLENEYLETIHEQLDILDKIKMEDAFGYFSSDFDMEQEYKELLTKYLAGDIHSIYMDMKSDTTFEGFESSLLKERNQKWIPKIDSLIHEKSCFIAVGAGHLPGEEGVINLLRNKGYIVKPVIE